MSGGTLLKKNILLKGLPVICMPIWGSNDRACEWSTGMKGCTTIERFEDSSQITLTEAAIL